MGVESGRGRGFSSGASVGCGFAWQRAMRVREGIGSDAFRLHVLAPAGGDLPCAAVYDQAEGPATG